MHGLRNKYAIYLDIYTRHISNYKHKPKIILLQNAGFLTKKSGLRRRRGCENKNREVFIKYEFRMVFYSLIKLTKYARNANINIENK